jgi:hypothetical protein
VNLTIPEVTWAAHELMLWGSNRGEGRLVVKFPFSLPSMMRAASSTSREAVRQRVAVQVAAWSRKCPVF